MGSTGGTLASVLRVRATAREATRGTKTGALGQKGVWGKTLTRVLQAQRSRRPRNSEVPTGEPEGRHGPGLAGRGKVGAEEAHPQGAGGGQGHRGHASRLPRGMGRTVRRCVRGPWSGAQGRAPAAGTVVVAAPQAGLDSAAPGDRGSVAAPNTTGVSKMGGRRVATHAPQPRSPFRYVRRRHSEEELSPAGRAGGGRQAAVAAACTWTLSGSPVQEAGPSVSAGSGTGRPR